MIPDIQSIFDSSSAANGAWFYVGKYSIWTLYVQNANDGVISVEAASIPTNNFVGIGNPANIGIQINNIQAPPFVATTGPWTANTRYTLGQTITDYNSNVQMVVQAGVSGPTVPTFSTNGQTSDNTIAWTFQQAQGNPNYNSATMSSATPAGVVICPSMNATVNPFTTITGGFGAVIFTSPNALYIPEDDCYVGFIRVRKTGGGSPPARTIAYLSGQVDS